VWDGLRIQDALFIGHTELCGYIAVIGENMKKYESGRSFNCSHFPTCEPLPKEVTKEEALDALCELCTIAHDNLEDSSNDESYNKVKDYINKT